MDPKKRTACTAVFQYERSALPVHESEEKTASMTDDEKIALLATDGMLVKRPLLIDEKGVLVGFREADYERMLQRGEEDV